MRTPTPRAAHTSAAPAHALEQLAREVSDVPVYVCSAISVRVSAPSKSCHRVRRPEYPHLVDLTSEI